MGTLQCEHMMGGSASPLNYAAFKNNKSSERDRPGFKSPLAGFAQTACIHGKIGEALLWIASVKKRQLTFLEQPPVF